MRNQKPLDTYEKVKEKALRLLEFRSHSEFELTQKLRHQGAKDEHIEDTLDFCRRYGFVNDKAYAQRKAADLINLKKYGLRRVKSELKAKGISNIIIDEVMMNLILTKNVMYLSDLLKKSFAVIFQIKILNAVYVILSTEVMIFTIYVTQ